MIASNAAIIRAISQTLSDSVLPQFEAATWPASNVRACITLLAFLEDRIAAEADVLTEDNKALKSLLLRIASGPAMSHLADELRAQLEAAVRPTTAQAGLKTASETESENEFCQALLSKIIRHLFEIRGTLDAEVYGRIREDVRTCLAAVHARDFGIAARAASFVPF